jgi:hypothetical protein
MTDFFDENGILSPSELTRYLISGEPLTEKGDPATGVDLDKRDYPEPPSHGPWSRESKIVKSIKLANRSKSVNFEKYNRMINEFAMASPENMASVIIFVIATQRNAWQDVMADFPKLLWHIKKTDGNLGMASGSKYMLHDQAFAKEMGILLGKNMSASAKAFDAIWSRRNEIYNKIRKAPDDVAVFETLLTIPMLQLVKAGFTAQLIIGKFGCIDSVNTYLYGVPTDMQSKGTLTFRPVQFAVKDGSRSDSLTAKSREHLLNYIQFIDSLKRSGQDSTSQQLWDDWCDIVAHRLIHSREDGIDSIEVDSGHRIVKIPTYMRRGNRERLANIREPLVKSEDPGAEIGKQHHDLVIS